MAKWNIPKFKAKAEAVKSKFLFLAKLDYKKKTHDQE